MKRIQELRKLSEDHHHGLVLARHAMLANDESSHREVWQEVLRKFQRELEPHFIIEEKYLAPPFESLGETALLKRFNGDHKKLRAIIHDQKNRSLSTLKYFGELLEAHIRFEEQELFEVAQSRLSSEDLQSVEKACELSSTK